MALSMALLTQLQADTDFLLVSLFIMLLGLGLGMVMQVIVLVVQNSVEYRDMGAATAGVNFFRSMGGAFGVALFGSVLTDRLDVNIARLVPKEALNGISSAALTASPERIRQLPTEVHTGVIEAFSRSLDTVFLVAVPIGLLAFALSWLLKEVPLREHAHISPIDIEGAPAPLPEAEAPEEEEPERREPIGVGGDD